MESIHEAKQGDQLTNYTHSNRRGSRKRRVHPRAGSGITEEQLGVITSALAHLQPKAKTTRRDVASKLSKQVRDAVQRGCTLAQIAEQMKANGVHMSVATLRRALREDGES